jgi:membrane protein implicated in regulation of membrane protease activity
MTPAEKWLVVAVVFLVVEIAPPATHFAALCLAFGALAAAIMAFFLQSPWIPWVTFVICSAILFPVLVPLAKFLFPKKPTNDESPNGSGDRPQTL